MVIVRDDLQPGVVGVTRIINVTFVEFLFLFVKLIHELLFFHTQILCKQLFETLMAGRHENNLQKAETKQQRAMHDTETKQFQAILIIADTL